MPRAGGIRLRHRKRLSLLRFTQLLPAHGGFGADIDVLLHIDNRPRIGHLVGSQRCVYIDIHAIHISRAGLRLHPIPFGVDVRLQNLDDGAFTQPRDQCAARTCRFSQGDVIRRNNPGSHGQCARKRHRQRRGKEHNTNHQ
ncbi:hypothetical protein SDC9_107891 [bioreactor metagenome]|uniref:Uncharacterized protein n=1 Tax=bioreactor metagenome TaxID=1076179 RepID=A0A645B6J9_9ZZZZ